MSIYRTLKGYNIKSVTSDLANPKEGQIWYNDTTNKIRAKIKISAAWSSGGALNTGRSGLEAEGPQTAAVAFGGVPPAGITGKTEEYDGSSWTESGDLNTARGYLGGCGIQTAALAFGGFNAPDNRYLNVSEEYDGSTWTEGNNLTTARDILKGCGTQTAGLAFGGNLPGNTAKTEEYNGTSWSEQNDLAQARRGCGSAGIQTAGLCFGGDQTPASPPVSLATEHYDGTSWTAGGNMPAVREGLQSGGIQTAALMIGGGFPAVAGCHQYDGTSWTTTADMANERADQGGSSGGGNILGLAVGSPPHGTAVEEYADTTEPVRSFDVS